jgi:hypothetical protein
MVCSRALVLALAVCLPAIASAQWHWVDRSGHAVFSDQPPPADIPAANIVRQPGNKSRAAAPEPAPAASEVARVAPALRLGASGAKPTGKEKELLEKKKQAEAAEEEKKKAHEQEVARVQAANCARARQSKTSFDSGARIARTNDKGEREFLNDDQRSAEVRRLEQVIATECKGG